MNRVRTASRTGLHGMPVRGCVLAMIIGLCCATSVRAKETATPPKAEAETTSPAVREAQLRVQLQESRVTEAKARLHQGQALVSSGQAGLEAVGQVAVLKVQLAQAMAEKEIAEQQLKMKVYEQEQAAADGSQPANPSVKIFRLRHAPVGEVADMLRQVYGRGLRVAVDERLNTVVVLGPSEVAPGVEQLINTLDTPPEPPRGGPEAERTLQLRVLWLMDGLPEEVGKEPDERYVSPMVVDVLHGLGLENPKIVCQHATTLSTQREGRSQFSLRDPVKIGDASAYMDGDGRLFAVDGDRFRIELRIGVEAESRGDHGRREGHRVCDLAGSLVMPLEHYVVVGTTNYVEQKDDGSVGASFPTAFVVFLQEAPIAPR